jgi:hypothetical protein
MITFVVVLLFNVGDRGQIWPCLAASKVEGTNTFLKKFVQLLAPGTKTTGFL